MRSIISVLLLLICLVCRLDAQNSDLQDAAVLSSIIAEFAGEKFAGDWKKLNENQNPSALSDILSKNEGKMKMNLTFENTSPSFALNFKLINGFSEEFGFMEFHIPNFAIYNTTNLDKEGIYTFPWLNVDVYTTSRYQIESKETIKAQITLNFSNQYNLIEQHLMQYFTHQNVTYQMRFTDIEICTNETNANTECTYTEVIGQFGLDKETKEYFLFYLFAVLLAVAKVACSADLLKKMTNPDFHSNKISSITAFMIFICNLSIVIGYLRPTIEDFSTLAEIPLFIVFWIGIMCADLTVWELVMQRDYLDRYGCCQKFLIGALIGCIFILISYLFVIFDSVKLFFMFCFVPQIIKNLQQSDLVPFQAPYSLIGTSLSFLFLLYYRGYPQNILDTYTSEPFCFQMVGILLVQSFVLILQFKRGPRFLLPERIQARMPNRYGKLIELKTDLEAANLRERACVICLQELDADPESEFGILTGEIVTNLKAKKGQILKTPCNHNFHIPCLVEWMQRKSECPVCRAKLDLLVS